MAHSFLSVEDFEESRCIKVTESILYIFMCYLVEALLLDSSKNKTKEYLIPHFELALIGSNYFGFIDFKLDYIYNENKDALNWYLSILKKTEDLILNTKSQQVILEKHFNKLPSKPVNLDSAYLNPKLIDLLNDIKWLLRYENYKPSNRFVYSHETYSN